MEEAARQAGSNPDDGGQRADGTDGTDEPDSPSLRVNPYGGKTTQELIAEAESLGRNCRNTGSTCGVRSPDGPSASPDAPPDTTPGVQLSEGNGHAEPAAKPMADQQVRPAATENVTVSEGASGETGGTPVPPAETEPEYNLSDIERLMRWQGKTLEEARQILRARLQAWKAWRKKGSMGPNPMHATPEPNCFAPNPGPTPPLCGPCEPPLTSASLRNLW